MSGRRRFCEKRVGITERDWMDDCMPHLMLKVVVKIIQELKVYTFEKIKRREAESLPIGGYLKGFDYGQNN